MKDPFKDLSQDFKDTVDALGNDEVSARKMIAEIALNNAALVEAQLADEDLAEKKEAVRMAMESYTPSYKAFKTQISYIRAHLASNGKSSGEVPGDAE